MHKSLAADAILMLNNCTSMRQIKQAPASTCNNKQLTRDPLNEYHSINTCMGGGHI